MALYQVISVHSNKESDCLAYPKKVSEKRVLKDFFKKWRLDNTNVQESSFKVVKV